MLKTNSSEIKDKLDNIAKSLLKLTDNNQPITRTQPQQQIQQQVAQPRQIPQQQIQQQNVQPQGQPQNVLQQNNQNAPQQNPIQLISDTIDNEGIRGLLNNADQNATDHRLGLIKMQLQLMQLTNEQNTQRARREANVIRSLCVQYGYLTGTTERTLGNNHATRTRTAVKLFHYILAHEQAPQAQQQGQ